MLLLQTFWLEITVGVVLFGAMVAFWIYVGDMRKRQEVGLTPEQIMTKRTLEAMADRSTTGL